MSATTAPSGEIPRPHVRYLMTTRGHLHSMKTYVWITLLIIAIMTFLYFVLGIGYPGEPNPPVLGNGPTGASGLYIADLYFHTIVIGIAALAAYMVVLAFDLDKYEPSIDLPLSYRALAATVLGAVGGFFYLRPVFNTWIAPIPLALIITAMLLMADVGGALLVELYLYPGKLTGSYHPEKNVLGMIPPWSNLPTFHDFRRMDATYWLTFVSVISAFVAGIIGFFALFANLWLSLYGGSPGVSPAFASYLAHFGMDVAAFAGNAMGAHSHLIGYALILGIVGVVAHRFGVMEGTRAQRTLTRIGVWVAIVGMIGVAVEQTAEAFVAWVPPILFSNTASNGVLNGWASDDTTMLVSALGAMLLLVPLSLTYMKGRSVWRDPIRAAILGTGILTFLANAVMGFYIESNESIYAAPGATGDAVFAAVQPFFAIFILPLVVLGFLALDFCQESSRVRTLLATLGGLGATLGTLGMFIYTFYEPSTGTLGYWFYVAGLLTVALFILVTTFTVLRGRDTRIPSSETNYPLFTKERPAISPAEA